MHDALVGVVNLTKRAQRGLFVEEDVERVRLLGLAQAGHAVGVVFLHQPPIGLLDFHDRRIGGDPEGFVDSSRPHRLLDGDAVRAAGAVLDLHAALRIRPRAIRCAAQRAMERDAPA